MAIQNFNQTYNNKPVVPHDGVMEVYSAPTFDSVLLQNVSKGNSPGRASGAYLDANGGRWFQITMYHKIRGQRYGYVFSAQTAFRQPENTPDVDGVEVVKDLMANEAKIFKNLAIAYRLYKKLPAGQKKETAEKTIKGLISRMVVRQQKLRNSDLIEFKEGFNEFMDEVIRGATNGIITGKDVGFGAVPLIVGAAIGAVVAVGSTVAIYYAFVPDYDESSRDLDVSDDLEELLSKEDPKTAQSIKDDLEKQIDEAYNQGKISGKFGGMFSIVSKLGLLLGGWFVISKFIDNQNNRALSRG